MFSINERIELQNQVASNLESTPLKSDDVKKAGDGLEKATHALVTAEASALAKKEAVTASSARVRDATAKAFDECRRARGALVAKDAALDEHLPRAAQQRTAPGVLARAALFLAKGDEAGVALPALAAARKHLGDAVKARVVARTERANARKGRVAAEHAWEAAYAALHAAVEHVLASRGLAGAELKAAVQAYLPARSTHRKAAAPQETPAPTEKGKPAA